ncbi:SDR family NAD(P)-dependent oxidoreductase [Kineococcus sp. SYSU DK002]|uniref:hypothetical protein n=1 Tax=Kineococcus sp. SYSU DK002 TaxID=3383123 RepID=UPI003D7CDF64
MLRHLVHLVHLVHGVHGVRGERTFAQDGPGTLVRWTYEFEPLPGRTLLVRRVPGPMWRDKPYQSLQAYRDSKLAQVLFSLELQRRLTASGSAVRSVLAHPGIAHTGLVDHSSQKTVLRVGGRFLNDAEHGALPTLFAATQDVPGNAYVGPDGLGSVKGHPLVRRPARRGLDATEAAELWRTTAALTGTR